MSALSAGKQAPNFSLPTIGGQNFTLEEALSHGPVVLAFFKVSCPVCQYAFPFYDRLYRALKGRNVTVIGISEDNSEDTAAFLKTFDVTMPIALEPDPYPVSNAYGLTNVPSLFEIDPDGKIITSSVGWDRADLESIYRQYSEATSSTPAPLFNSGEKVADFKAG
jgi:peroxiredoxin